MTDVIAMITSEKSSLHPQLDFRVDYEKTSIQLAVLSKQRTGGRKLIVGDKILAGAFPPPLSACMQYNVLGAGVFSDPWIFL